MVGNLQLPHVTQLMYAITPCGVIADTLWVLLEKKQKKIPKVEQVMTDTSGRSDFLSAFTSLYSIDTYKKR
jgi:hypothetical protein